MALCAMRFNTKTMLLKTMARFHFKTLAMAKAFTQCIPAYCEALSMALLPRRFNNKTVLLKTLARFQLKKTIND